MSMLQGSSGTADVMALMTSLLVKKIKNNRIKVAHLIRLKSHEAKVAVLLA